MIEYTYRMFVSVFIKEKISILFNPFYTLNMRPSNRPEKYFNVCKKELKF